MLLCRGQGLEPHLEFERQLVEFGPILPHSSGDEQDVIIRNPCSFPIEFYNLEFDPQYLEEEKVRGKKVLEGISETEEKCMQGMEKMEKSIKKEGRE